MTVKRDLFSNGSIAHSSLKDVVAAERYVGGVLKRVSVPVADLRLKPDGGLDRQILHGHPVLQLETDQGLSRDETTGYVGYVSPHELKPWVDPSHRVSVQRTFVFREPDFKCPDPQTLSCGSLLCVAGIEGRFLRLLDGGYVLADHLTPYHASAPDLVYVAERLLGTPYLWGGNSAFGIDCSGLVQLACQMTGHACSGDSDQQMRELGSDLPPGTAPRRNDLMFWKGHVALLHDAKTLIHANAYHLAVALEPLAEALARIEAQGDGQLLVHKRVVI